MTPTADNIPHFVYRCYDTNDTLLYVGCTADVTKRMRDHGARADWVARSVRMTIEEYPDKKTGRAAESAAIFAELPEANVLGKPIHRERARTLFSNVVTGSDYSAAVARVLVTSLIEMDFTVEDVVDRTGIPKVSLVRKLASGINLNVAELGLIAPMIAAEPSEIFRAASEQSA